MGQFPTFMSATILLQFFFIFFFHFFHNFLLLFIIMFAKIALIVGLMICASINTEAKRRLPAPVSLNEKYLIRIIYRKLDRIPKTIAILKKRYPENDGSWEEVEAEIKAGYNSLKEKKPTTMRQLLDLIQGINKRIDNYFSAYPLDEERLHEEVQAMLYPVPGLMLYLRSKYRDYEGSWEEVEANIRDGIKSIEEKKPTTVGQLNTLKDAFREKIQKMLGGKKFTRKLLLQNDLI